MYTYIYITNINTLEKRKIWIIEFFVKKKNMKILWTKFWKKNGRIDLQFLKDNIKYITLLFNLFIIIILTICYLLYCLKT